MRSLKLWLMGLLAGRRTPEKEAASQDAIYRAVRFCHQVDRKNVHGMVKAINDEMKAGTTPQMAATLGTLAVALAEMLARTLTEFGDTPKTTRDVLEEVTLALMRTDQSLNDLEGLDDDHTDD